MSIANVPSIHLTVDSNINSRSIAGCKLIFMGVKPSTTWVAIDATVIAQLPKGITTITPNSKASFLEQLTESGFQVRFYHYTSTSNPGLVSIAPPSSLQDGLGYSTKLRTLVPRWLVHGSILLSASQPLTLAATSTNPTLHYTNPVGGERAPGDARLGVKFEPHIGERKRLPPRGWMRRRLAVAGRHAGDGHGGGGGGSIIGSRRPGESPHPALRRAGRRPPGWDGAGVGGRRGAAGGEANGGRALGGRASGEGKENGRECSLCLWEGVVGRKLEEARPRKNFAFAFGESREIYILWSLYYFASNLANFWSEMHSNSEMCVCLQDLKGGLQSISSSPSLHTGKLPCRAIKIYYILLGTCNI